MKRGKRGLEEESVTDLEEREKLVKKDTQGLLSSDLFLV